GWWDWLTPFSLLTGVALVVGYALLGATWLVMKTEGYLLRRARGFAWTSGIATLGLIGIVSLWSPFLNPVYLERWFAWPTVIFSVFVPLLVAVCVGRLLRDLLHHRLAQPFLTALGLFAHCYAGIGISFYPYIVQTSAINWRAAGPD